MAKITAYLVIDGGVLIKTEDQGGQIIETAKIAEAFETYGGSFTKALWVALYRADAINTAKILINWEHDVKEYIQTFILSQK